MVVWSSQCHNIFWLHQQRWVWENHGEQSPGGRGQHKVPVYWQRTNGDVCCHSHRKIQVCCHSNRNIQICCHSHRYVLFVIDKYKYVSWSQKNTNFFGDMKTKIMVWKHTVVYRCKYMDTTGMISSNKFMKEQIGKWHKLFMRSRKNQQFVPRWVHDCRLDHGFLTTEKIKELHIRVVILLFSIVLISYELIILSVLLVSDTSCQLMLHYVSTILEI